MASSSLDLEDFTSFVVPSGVLSDEEQLSLFKIITLKQKDPTSKFRIKPRTDKGHIRIPIEQIFQEKENSRRLMSTGYTQNVSVTETTHIQSNKIIRRLSADINLSSYVSTQEKPPTVWFKLLKVMKAFVMAMGDNQGVKGQICTCECSNGFEFGRRLKTSKNA